MLRDAQVKNAASDVRTYAGTDVCDFILEAALLHGRCLHEFFGNRTRHDDDVQAVDYVPGWAAPPFLREHELKAVHKNLAHLTTARLVRSAR